MLCRNFHQREAFHVADREVYPRQKIEVICGQISDLHVEGAERNSRCEKQTRK